MKIQLKMNFRIFRQNKRMSLCLNMIVKNESKIIKRCLDSVVSVIDCFCIVDTGSTDETKEIIENYFNERNIPGKVVNEPFQNFEYNRNHALKCCEGMSDFILLTDADMILQVKAFNKEILSCGAHEYSILQGDHRFQYRNTRIVRNDGTFSYKGVTHEYIERNIPSKRLDLPYETIFYLDLKDGGSKADKFDRDIRLLTNALQLEPDNSRYVFYLANSYHDCGRFEEAIEHYKKRSTMGGYSQEVWYSFYRIGLSWFKLNEPEKAICAFLEAYNENKDRLENIYEIIKYYRIQGKQKVAYTFYELAEKVLQKKNNRSNYLFLHKEVYDYKIYYEYSILACYNGVKLINDEIVQIFNNCSNSIETNQLLSNMKYYKFIPIKKREELVESFYLKKEECYLEIKSWYPLNVINEKNTTCVEQKTPLFFSLFTNSVKGKVNNDSVFFIVSLQSLEKEEHNYHVFIELGLFDCKLISYTAPFKISDCAKEKIVDFEVNRNEILFHCIINNTAKIVYYDKAHIQSLLVYHESS